MYFLTGEYAWNEVVHALNKADYGVFYPPVAWTKRQNIEIAVLCYLLYMRLTSQIVKNSQITGMWTAYSRSFLG